MPRADCFFLEEQLTRVGVLWAPGLYGNCPALVFPSVSGSLLVFVFVHRRQPSVSTSCSAFPLAFSLKRFLQVCKFTLNSQVPAGLIFRAPQQPWLQLYTF